MEVLNLLYKTVLLRPYVFLFLGAFLFSAVVNLGWRRALIYWWTTWAIAFISEYSSTRTGFPYGLYHYTQNTRGEELFISNVPFMDSLSYSFLLFASHSMAVFSLAPLYVKRFQVGVLDTFNLRMSRKVALLTGLYMLLIDFVIDPVALRGDRWFLGKIYTYEYEGYYFGVPLSNALGWGLVGLLAMLAIQQIEKLYLGRKFRDPSIRLWPFRGMMGVGIYYGVLIFNLAITWAIGERGLFIAGASIFLLPTVLLLLRLFDTRLRVNDQEWKNHLNMLR